MRFQNSYFSNQNGLAATGLLLAGVLAVLAPGCSKRSEPAPAPAPEPAAAPAAAPATAPPPVAVRVPVPMTASGEAVVQEQLRALTQAVRSFSLDRKRVPASLEEVVAARYLSRVPAPPPGKKFAINAQRAEVILVNQ